MEFTGDHAIAPHHAVSDTDANTGAAWCTRTGYIVDDPVAVIVFVIADFTICCRLRHADEAPFLAMQNALPADSVTTRFTGTASTGIAFVDVSIAIVI